MLNNSKSKECDKINQDTLLFHLIRRQDKDFINGFEDSFGEEGEDEMEEAEDGQTEEKEESKTPLEI